MNKLYLEGQVCFKQWQDLFWLARCESKDLFLPFKTFNHHFLCKWLVNNCIETRTPECTHPVHYDIFLYSPLLHQHSRKELNHVKKASLWPPNCNTIQWLYGGLQVLLLLFSNTMSTCDQVLWCHLWKQEWEIAHWDERKH